MIRRPTAKRRMINAISYCQQQLAEQIRKRQTTIDDFLFNKKVSNKEDPSTLQT